MLVPPTVNHSDWEIVCFFKVARSFMFKKKNSLEVSSRDVLSVVN